MPVTYSLNYCMLHTGPAHHGQCALRDIYKWHEQIKKALSPSILIRTSPIALAIEEVMKSTDDFNPGTVTKSDDHQTDK